MLLLQIQRQQVCSASQEIRVTRLRKRQYTLLRVASAGLIYWVARFFLLGTKARILGLTVTCLQSSPIGTNFAGFCSNLKQFNWCKRCGLLFKFKALLLVQKARAFFKLRRPPGFSALPRAFTGCILIGWLQVTRWGRGIPPFQGKLKPKSRPPASPSPSSPT